MKRYPIAYSLRYALTVWTMCNALLFPAICAEKITDSKQNLGNYDDLSHMPNDCLQRKFLKFQPTASIQSRIKKCCPLGESLNAENFENQEQKCSAIALPFNPSVIHVALYEDCIEDEEIPINLEIDITNPCNTSLLYTNDEDIFYIIQDGSLLILDGHANKSYTIETSYCIDNDSSGNTLAFVCTSTIKEHIERYQLIISAFIMMIDTPFLLLTIYLHLIISELRNLNGYILCSMTMCLSVANFILSISNIFNMKCNLLGYIMQFFYLSYFLWYFCLCGHMALTTWFIIPYNLCETSCANLGLYLFFMCLSLLIPMFLVILTIKKGYPGYPSYFLQGFTFSVRSSQKYFIPPVTAVIFGSFLVIITIFLGLKQIERQYQTKNETEYYEPNGLHHYNIQKLNNIKKAASNTIILGMVILFLWILEMFTFYTPQRSYLKWMDLINCFQGMFIFAIFFSNPKDRHTVTRWWFNKGSHSTEKIELGIGNQET